MTREVAVWLTRPAWVALVVAGCGAGWHQAPAPASGMFPPNQQVQVWHGGKVEQLHAVLIGPDSVTGIPYFRPLTCDSCRIAIPRSATDSIRLGDPVAGFWKSFALVAGTLGTALAILAASIPRT